MSVRKQLRACDGSLKIKVDKTEQPSDTGCEIRRDGRIWVNGKPIGKVVSINENETKKAKIDEAIDERLDEIENLPETEQDLIDEIGDEIETLEKKKRKIHPSKKWSRTLNTIYEIILEMRVGIRPYYVYRRPGNTTKQNIESQQDLTEKKYYMKYNIIDILKLIENHDMFDEDLNFIPIYLYKELMAMKEDIINSNKKLIEELGNDSSAQATHQPLSKKEFYDLLTTEKTGNLLLFLSKLDNIEFQLRKTRIWESLEQYHCGSIVPPDQTGDADVLDVIESETHNLLVTTKEKLKMGDVADEIYGRILGEAALKMDEENFSLSNRTQRLIKFVIPDNLGIKYCVNQKGKKKEITGDLFLDPFLFETYGRTLGPNLAGLYNMGDDSNAVILQVITKIDDVPGTPRQPLSYFESENGQKYNIQFFLSASTEINPGTPITVKSDGKLVEPEVIKDFDEEPIQPPLSPQHEPEEPIVDLGPPQEPPKEPVKEPEPIQEPVKEPEIHKDTYPKIKKGDVVEWDGKKGQMLVLVKHEVMVKGEDKGWSVDNEKGQNFEVPEDELFWIDDQELKDVFMIKYRSNTTKSKTINEYGKSYPYNKKR